jgi:uncharacterized protein (TIGR02246 family)
MTTNPTSDGIDQLPQEDQDAIATTLGALLNGFQGRDADQLQGVYADDADWVNAFGSVKKGRAEIVGYLRGLFVDANFNAGNLVAPPDSAIRRLTDDVVLVSTHLQIRGQLLVDGDTIDLRDNHSLRVLARHPDGRWLIESEMYMDANTDQSYVNHS